jgi:hypothetical protein
MHALIPLVKFQHILAFWRWQNGVPTPMSGFTGPSQPEIGISIPLIAEKGE